MPLNNALEIFKVIFLDTSKHTLGRNYGVLCTWVAVNTLLFSGYYDGCVQTGRY